MSSIMACTVVVRNIPDALPTEGLTRLLRTAGDVEQVVRSHSGCEVVYATPAGARQALRMTGIALGGGVLEVVQEHMQATGDVIDTARSTPQPQHTATPTEHRQHHEVSQAGVGIGPQLLNMIRNNPGQAKAMMPLLKQGAACTPRDIVALGMITEFHERRAQEAVAYQSAGERHHLELALKQARQRTAGLENRVNNLKRQAEAEAALQGAVQEEARDRKKARSGPCVAFCSSGSPPRGASVSSVRRQQRSPCKAQWEWKGVEGTAL